MIELGAEGEDSRGQAEGERNSIVLMHRVLATLSILALLAVQAVPAARAAGGDMRDYRLAPGDRITITVFGQPELSGDFFVDGVGNIQMPIVGAIAVAKTTIDACRRLIEARLADGVLRKPGVSVRVAELRPIFIMGDVRAVGSYPFRFGLTPLNALALAGGIGSGERRSSATDAEIAAAEERVTILTATRQALQVRRARLQAEQAGSRSFELPSALKRERDSRIEAMVRQEHDQLASAIEAHESQIHLLRQQQPRIEAEVAALKARLQAETRQLELTSERLKEYDKLSGQGLGRASTTLDLQRQQALDEANMHRLRAELSRLDVTAGDLEIRIQDVQIVRRQRIMSALAENNDRLREVELSLAAAQDLLGLRRNYADGLGDQHELELTHQMRVIRDIDGHLKVLDPTVARILEPGDIVEIRRLRPTGAVAFPPQTGRPPPAHPARTGARPDPGLTWPARKGPMARTADVLAL
jgi:polysaccharide biosynthesis/export protein